MLSLRKPPQQTLLLRRDTHLVTMLTATLDIRAPATAKHRTLRVLLTQPDHTPFAQRSDPAPCGDHTASVSVLRWYVHRQAQLARLTV